MNNSNRKDQFSSLESLTLVMTSLYMGVTQKNTMQTWKRSSRRVTKGMWHSTKRNVNLTKIAWFTMAWCSRKIEYRQIRARWKPLSRRNALEMPRNLTHSSAQSDIVHDSRKPAGIRGLPETRWTSYGKIRVEARTLWSIRRTQGHA